MSSQLHAYIENVLFILLCYTFPAVGSQTVVEEHRGDVPCGDADVLSGVTAVGLLIGRNMVGMKWPQIIDRLGTFILHSQLFLVSLTL